MINNVNYVNSIALSGSSIAFLWIYCFANNFCKNYLYVQGTSKPTGERGHCPSYEKRLGCAVFKINGKSYGEIAKIASCSKRAALLYAKFYK